MAIFGNLSDLPFPEIFNMIGQGLNPRTIAERLGLSVKTVEAHRENIKGKLSLAARSRAIAITFSMLLKNISQSSTCEALKR